MRASVCTLLGAICAVAFTSASAQTQVFTPQPHVVMNAAATPARYVVRAIDLYANDETGRDWPGSDEIYAVFDLSAPDRAADAWGFSARTSVFEDFDTGERKAFDAAQNCLISAVAGRSENGLAREWDCDLRGEAGDFQFTVRLYEEDAVEDDQIGERTVRWSQAELAQANLPVGGATEESIRIGGYTLRWRVERVS